MRNLAGIVLLAALYYGAAHLGYALGFTGPVAAIVWLPVGVGIAFLYLGGIQYWPGALAGDLLANNYSTLPVGSAIGQTCGNLLEVTLAALLMRRMVPLESPLGSVRRVAWVLLALAAGTALSATVGLLSARLGNVVATGALPKLWRTWWLGDLTGALIVVPLALAWWPPRLEWVRRHALELAVVVAVVAAVGALAFHTNDPLTYLVFPALIWAALRLRQRGATLAVAVAAGFALWSTTHSEGPFAFHSITRGVLETQLYIAVAALSSLFLAAVVSEREALAQGLRASRSRLVRVADTERRRIEHNLHDGAQQRLTALAVYLAMAAEETRERPQNAAALFEGAETNLLTAIDELRDLAHGMHPAVLREHGLAVAIEAVARRSVVPVDLVDSAMARFDDASEETAYFVILEAITNAQKHAHSSSIRVRVKWAAGVLRVEVADDGIGGADASGEGLRGLRDRVDAFGGTFVLLSPIGGGTRVEAAIPATITPS